ncbi:type II secretion system protein [bacterium]|nr:type II secretion system protein [bacterium]
MTNKLNRFTVHNSLFTNFAFTLAETLIVMGIIGFVAALTLPNLNSSTGNKEKVAKLQKLYSNLNDAFGRATAVYGPLETWGFTGSDKNYRGAERIVEFMKLSKSCGLTDKDSCFKYPGTNDSMPTYVTADGAALLFWVASKCDNNADYQCGAIDVDIDGTNKGKNTKGVDYFAFSIKKDGIYPAGGRQDSRTSTDALVNVNCVKPDSRWQNLCAGWVIENGNMDYLKADSSGKCPDGKTILNWTNITCK